MISIENLTKYYGPVRAVNRINFQVKEGEILGFLGPNGAGKSTTLKMLTCFMTPTEGVIKIGNYNIYDHSTEIREMIGYLPENNPLYTEMIVYDYLKYIGTLRGLTDDQFKNSLKNVIDKCGIRDVISKPINTLSKGYRQRVGIAQAIIHDPKILILDEPTAGLDPNQIVEIRELIKELGQEKTLILSSHILQEVQAVCSRIIIINKGDIVADGKMEDLQTSFQGTTRLNIEMISKDFDSEDLLSNLPEIQIVDIRHTPSRNSDS
jgi:ABC-2 type transport system ATP-binding protein